ncbi:hypothetical protein [Streptomyces sp. NPDC001930]|uniref:hypothetical protein n=1 Tax=Streptomyces sp. NPDC001930 TaxID=3364625 RepID=UPI0036AE413E
MKQRLIRAARYTAGLAVSAAHMLLALWAGAAAGGFAWRHGYTLPLDAGSSDPISAAIVFGLVAAGAVLVVPEPWMTQVRHLVMGRPLDYCPTCGGLAEPPAQDTDVNTPKETAQ